MRYFVKKVSFFLPKSSEEAVNLPLKYELCRNSIKNSIINMSSVLLICNSKYTSLECPMEDCHSVFSLSLSVLNALVYPNLVIDSCIFN